MIGFGFTIYKFFEYIGKAETAEGIAKPHAPRNLALALIFIGTLSLAVAILQYWQFLKSIGVRERGHLWSLSVIVALLMVLVGALAFISVLLRTGPF